MLVVSSRAKGAGNIPPDHGQCPWHGRGRRALVGQSVGDLFVIANFVDFDSLYGRAVIRKDTRLVSGSLTVSLVDFSGSVDCNGVTIKKQNGDLHGQPALLSYRRRSGGGGYKGGGRGNDDW